MARAWRTRLVHDGAGWRRDRLVVADAGRVVAIEPASAPFDGPVEDLAEDAVLAPGLIDLQVNGGGGVMLNDVTTADGIAAIAAAHARFGTRGLMPTLISATRPKIAEAVAAVRAAIERGVPGILGIHIEGPFLSPERAGVHPPQNLIRPEPADVDLVASLGAAGRTLVTLAPEQVPAGFVAALVARGVVVAAGHSNAGPAAMGRAADEGMTGVTHLFNAMAQLGSREPGVVGMALADLRLSAGIIADGHHVAWPSFVAAWRALGPERMMLVTDAMATVGATSDRFDLFGETIRVADGRLVNRDGRLAGAHIGLDEAVRRAHLGGGVPLGAAIRMASATPARFLGLGPNWGRLAVGSIEPVVIAGLPPATLAGIAAGIAAD